MVLAGLPAPAAGSVVLCSFFSVLVSTAGLALLRGTRPSEVGGHVVYVHAMYRVLGVFGALLLFSGHVLGDIPMLMGVSTKDEGTAAAIMQCTFPLMCWVADRYFVTGRPLPLIQAALCGLAWFGSTLMEWAGPKPFDNLTAGLDGQMAGCDGGFRSPFLIYASIWLTVIMFGTFLFFCDDGNVEARHGKVAALEAGSNSSLLGPKREQQLTQEAGFRRLMLPVLAGGSASMCGLVFADGAAGNEMGWIFMGACLIVVAVLAAWDWLWRLELSLSSWASIYAVAACLLRMVQGHLVFRDFRWDPDSESGLLVMWKTPGLQLFMLGFFILFLMFMFYLTCADQWTDSEIHGVISLEELHQQSSAPEFNPIFGGLQWLLVPISMYCFYRGVTEDLIVTDVVTPHVAWAQTGLVHNSTAHGTASDHHLSGQSYMDLINLLYDRRLPCSALAVSYAIVIQTPIQFAYVLLILARPWFNPIPDHLYSFMQTELAQQAPGRLTNPMVLMLMVALQNIFFLELKHFEATLGSGFWFFLAYCWIMVVLTSMMGLGREFDATVEGSKDRNLTKKRATNGDDSDNSSYDGDDADSDDIKTGEDTMVPMWAACLVGLMFAAVVTTILGLTLPFLVFEVRLSGIIVRRTDPSILEFWQQLYDYYPLLGLASFATLTLCMLVWVPLRLLVASSQMLRLGSMLSHMVYYLEMGCRPWVMGHHWSVSCLVLYYIVTARNKAVIEVCAHFPDAPIGLLSVAAMGGAVVLMHMVSPRVSTAKRPAPSRPVGVTVPSTLPGGITVWYVGPVLTMCFWILLLFNHGPVAEPEIQSLDDVNTMLSRLLPATNEQLRQRLPESGGDCERLTQHRGGSPQNCVGHKPFAHHSSTRTSGITQTKMDISAEWAEGLNTLTVLDLSIAEPGNVTNASVPESWDQVWNVTLSGMFTDLNVMMKVDLNGKEFIRDYLCCKTPFNFVIQVSAVCSQEAGFSDFTLHVLHLDTLDFIQKGYMSNLAGTTATFQVDYGSFSAVEEALRSFMTGKTGHLVIENTDGSTTDPSIGVGKVLEEIVHMNAGTRCVQHY